MSVTIDRPKRANRIRINQEQKKVFFQSVKIAGENGRVRLTENLHESNRIQP
jgi:hypothetical protein